MIRNLLFDLGGVIMDIRRENAVKALKELGMRDVESFLGDDYSQKGSFLQLERGEITTEEFRRDVRRYIDAPVTDGQIDDAFCKFLIGIPVKRLHELAALRSEYKVYMLSNTNPLMWERFILPEFRKDGHDVNYYFDGIVTSFSVRAYKPEPAIFKAVERDLGIIPSETMFFDDSPRNVEASCRLGFHGVLVRPGTEFIDLIKE